jgi:drug/metabolite transporter (DMT)-like permease
MSRRSWILFALVGCIWGLPYLFIKIALRELTPETMILFRSVLGGVALLPFALRERRFDLIKRYWKGLLIYSIVEMVIPWYLLARAEERLSSSFSGLLVATVPAIGLVFALIFRSEAKVRGIRLAGLLVGFVGVVIVIGINLGSTNALSVGEVVVTACGYALGPTLLNRYLAELPPITMVAYSMIFTAIIYLPFGLFHLPTHLSGEVLGSVFGLGLLCSMTGFILFFMLILDVGPARATVVTYINPIIAVLAGVVFLHEYLGTGIAIGFPLVVIGSVLATWGATHPVPTQPVPTHPLPTRQLATPPTLNEHQEAVEPNPET